MDACEMLKEAHAQIEEQRQLKQDRYLKTQEALQPLLSELKVLIGLGLVRQDGRKAEFLSQDDYVEFRTKEEEFMIIYNIEWPDQYIVLGGGPPLYVDNLQEALRAFIFRIAPYLKPLSIKDSE